jgi:hypothetical protein
MFGELLRQLDPEMFFALLIVGGSLASGTLITLGSVALITWRKARRDEMTFELKREMLEQGMSADDIAKVIGAAPPRPAWTAGSPWSCGGKRRRHAIMAASAASASLS